MRGKAKGIATTLAAAAALIGVAACGGGPSGAQASSGPAVTSEADSVLHMDAVRASGYTGAGVRVGVVSTGVVNLASYQSAGTLPDSVYVSQKTAGMLDEGSWMLELVHQHAPDAVLGFCDGLDLDFAGCIKDLANNFHADIIVDDILFSGQFYPDATADIVTELEAANDRLLFIHLAGNEQQGGYWQGPFIATQAALGGATETVLDFGLASGGASDPFNTISVPAGAHLILILNWNDPPHGAANHALTAHLLDHMSHELAHVSGQSDPTVRLDYTNASVATQTVRLTVSLDGGTPGGLSVQLTEGSPTCNIECQPLTHTSAGLAGGTIGDFPDALVIGATNAISPHQLEAWTNHGPFRIDFQASPDPAAPDGYDYARLATPTRINKPDLVAPDCVTVPFSNGTSLNTDTFCGTSAAVPAIAGAAALLESAGFNRARVLKALRSTAVPLGSAAWDPGYGFGLADAAAALKSGG
ncbi:MAG TPA: S8 family serine peptidase [Steroidobacteraceae bacterium]|jgi:hypothetical protein